MRTLFAVTMLALAACGGDAARNAAEVAQMDSGLAQLRAGDNATAEQTFRGMLQRNPTHYGARYQLAVALDRAGRPVEARPVWEEVSRNADLARDSATLATARARLALPDTVGQTQLMQTGLDLMNRQSNPTAAAEQFRQILQRNPTHYGATFQLATALDRAGQRAQARPIWEKVLGMAVSSRDQPTVDAARARLRARD